MCVRSGVAVGYSDCSDQRTKMKTTELQNAARHLRSWAPTLFVAVLLFGFTFIALEVTGGGPIAFDRWLLVAFRHASDLSRPIGPPWLLDVVRASPHWAVRRYLHY